MLDTSISSQSKVTTQRMIRPIGAYALYGLAEWNDRMVTLDHIRGYLLQIDPLNDNAVVINPLHTESFIGATGLAIAEDTIWFTQENSVYCSDVNQLNPQVFITLPYPADGVGTWGSTVYVTCQKAGYIFVYERDSRRKITQFPLPGVGPTNLTVRDEELWLVDRIEQTVYLLDRATGELQFSILTPFENPTALAFINSTLYITYATEEAYIRDNPNADPSHELTYRDRTFIHPLDFYYNTDERYTLSNGYLIEMFYVEELLPLDEVTLDNVEWRIALPSETHRQKIRSVEAISVTSS
jgi:hypothetical protein